MVVGVTGIVGVIMAWQTAPRDQWIGWSHEQRQRNLAAVVNNARFLILPWIRVPSLASKLLGLAARTLPGHWQARYGYRPYLLETFVEAERFRGTGYRAANWRCVGKSPSPSRSRPRRSSG
ncbi:Druantia anti-phage system protein DruA [Lamprobacter sp.]|uniref:Druantia anti-phage system protein DruA n=1 Tax=Lamprobacter sp. TaxID=3100796 RepID=UPI002B25C208|nr:Druantia anti-phage system protein DruA [Lamprobacter sp.]